LLLDDVGIAIFVFEWLARVEAGFGVVRIWRRAHSLPWLVTVLGVGVSPFGPRRKRRVRLFGELRSFLSRGSNSSVGFVDGHVSPSVTHIAELAPLDVDAG
jgi:prepilin-type processing-associated H-X9-DG protein